MYALQNNNSSVASAATAALPPEALVMQISAGFMLSQALYVAAKLGVADLLADEPRSIDELAKSTGTHAPSLYRFMRALAASGVFAENPDGQFELTPPAELLRTDAPASLRDFVIFIGDDLHWHTWAKALYSAQTGKTAFEHVYGMEIFPYLAKNPEPAQIFDRAMTSLSAMATPAVIEAYDFSSINKLIDVAGGHGSLLAGILKANPQVAGALFDMPPVIEGAKKLLEKEGVAARCELIAGDFFESVPVGGDAYLMKHIIHDWDDERASQILKNCHRAMKIGGKVLLVEMVVASRNEPQYAKLQDLEMLLFPGGCERTEDEYRKLFDANGFKLTRIIPTKSPLNMIEAVKK